MAHKDWCGRSCGECETGCEIDRNIICFLNCENLNPDGNRAKEKCCEAGCDFAEQLTLTYLGRDGWDRPVYDCDGRLYVDVDPRHGRGPEIFTKQDNLFEGEPSSPVAEGTFIKFLPRRDTWGSSYEAV